MRSTVVAGLLIMMAASAHAAEPSSSQSCIALGSGTSRVAAMVANPADRCSGRLQCAQYLSTTTVVRPAQAHRT